MSATPTTSPPERPGKSSFAVTFAFTGAPLLGFLTVAAMTVWSMTGPRTDPAEPAASRALRTIALLQREQREARVAQAQTLGDIESWQLDPVLKRGTKYGYAFAIVASGTAEVRARATPLPSAPAGSPTFTVDDAGVVQRAEGRAP